MNSLKLAILAAGIKQYELARRVQMTETRLSRLATGRAVPTDEERHRLADALGVPQAGLVPSAA